MQMVTNGVIISIQALLAAADMLTVNQLSCIAVQCLDYWNREPFISAPKIIVFPSTTTSTFYTIHSAACA